MPEYIESYPFHPKSTSVYCFLGDCFGGKSSYLHREVSFFTCSRKCMEKESSTEDLTSGKTRKHTILPCSFDFIPTWGIPRTDNLFMVSTAKWSKEARSCSDFFMISLLGGIFQTYECIVLARKKTLFYDLLTSGYDHFTPGNVGENRAKAKDFSWKQLLHSKPKRKVSISFPWLRYYQVFLNGFTRWVRFPSIRVRLLHGNHVPYFLQFF